MVTMNVLAERKAKGLTIRELARKSGVSRGLISKIERGKQILLLRLYAN